MKKPTGSQFNIDIKPWHLVGNHQCRWPVGERSVPCGCQVKEGKPYCEDHCKRAYVRTISIEEYMKMLKDIF